MMLNVDKKFHDKDIHRVEAGQEMASIYLLTNCEHVNLRREDVIAIAEAMGIVVAQTQEEVNALNEFRLMKPFDYSLPSPKSK